MGCCGEPIDKPTEQEKKAAINLNGNGIPTSQQPVPHPGAQMVMQQPTISSPPPAQQLTMQHTGGFQQAQPWIQPTQSPPPIANQFNPYALATSTSPGPLPNQFTGTTVNGMGPNSSLGSTINAGLQRPSPVHPGSPFQAANNAMMASGIPPQQRMSAIPMEFQKQHDEGKMSVAIDFGEF